MDAIEPWIRDALTDEVEETVREYLWNDVLRWVWDEGISSSDARCDEQVMGRLYLLELILGKDAVQPIWDRVRKKIDARIAVAARRVVPAEVVRRWLARDVSDDRPDRAAEVTPVPGTEVMDDGTLDALLGDLGTTPDDPDRQVLDGLRLLGQAAADRDLAVQLGLTDANSLPTWLRPPSRDR